MTQYTKKEIEEFKEEFRKKRPAARQKFYDEYTRDFILKTYRSYAFHFVDYNSLRSMSSTGAAKNRKGKYESFHVSVNSRYSMMSKKVRPEKINNLNLFFLTCTFKTYTELVDNLLAREPYVLFAHRPGFFNCCGIRTYSFQKQCHDDFLSGLMTEQHMKDWLQENERPGGASGWFMFIPTNMSEAFDGLLTGEEWLKCFEYEGETHPVTVRFKIKLLPSHQQRVTQRGQVYDRVPKKVLLKDLPDKHRTKIHASKYTEDSQVYYGFSNTSTNVTRDSFKYSRYKVDFLVVRDQGSNLQIYHNLDALKRMGFKSLYKGFKPFQNSSHSSASHWLWPMYRINPHFEEDL